MENRLKTIVHHINHIAASNIPTEMKQRATYELGVLAADDSIQVNVCEASRYGLGYAFTWSETPQGYDYWKELYEALYHSEKEGQ